MTKQIISTIKVLTLAVVLSFGLSYVYAWTAPTAPPPTGNVSAPINTGSATASQTILGKLTVTATTTTGTLISSGLGVIADSVSTNNLTVSGGTAGQVLASGAGGVATWTTPASVSHGKKRYTISENTTCSASSCTGTFTAPAGVTKVWVTAAGGGGGGGGGHASNSVISGGVGGTSYSVTAQEISVLSSNYNITVGYGGSPAGAVGTDGGPGGPSSFGSLLVLPPGAGGKTATNIPSGANGTPGGNGGTYLRTSFFNSPGGAGGRTFFPATAGTQGFVLVEW